MTDLTRMFLLRREYIRRLWEKFPEQVVELPVDPSTKKSQVLLRDTVLKGVEEVFEALQHCKNARPHRKTLIPNFDRAAFLEEIIDAFNFFFSVLVFLGVTPEELMEAYEKKHTIICERLENGY